jgi:hypothetical protein
VASEVGDAMLGLVEAMLRSVRGADEFLGGRLVYYALVVGAVTLGG